MRGDAVLAAALVALTHRRESEPHRQLQMPGAPDPAGLERIYAPPPQGLQSDIRQVAGEYDSGDTRGLIWVRDASGRRLDHLLLAYLADQCAPRSFLWGGGPSPSATISMSVYFQATDDELAAVGDDYFLNEATGTRLGGDPGRDAGDAVDRSSQAEGAGSRTRRRVPRRSDRGAEEQTVPAV